MSEEEEYNNPFYPSGDNQELKEIALCMFCGFIISYSLMILGIYP